MHQLIVPKMVLLQKPYFTIISPRMAFFAEAIFYNYIPENDSICRSHILQLAHNNQTRNPW